MCCLISWKVWMLLGILVGMGAESEGSPSRGSGVGVEKWVWWLRVPEKGMLGSRSFGWFQEWAQEAPQSNGASTQVVTVWGEDMGF